MRIKCFSVRLKDLVSISEKAYKATAFDGSTAIIPKNQVLKADCGVHKSDAYWIQAWFLQKTNLQYSSKKCAYFDEDGNILPSYTIKTHVPEKVTPRENNIIDELRK